MKWALALVVLAGVSSAEPRRFALVAGENRGIAGEETLRFAVDDARRVREVLISVGGVAADDVVLLEGVSAETLRAGLSRLSKLLERASPSDRLFVYVSGHAGDGVLHLDGTEFALTELVDFVKRAPVEVGVLVVDACRSGSMTKVKGLSRVEDVPVRVEASGLAGRVLIAASGADEYAQESDTLRGSTFTHHFLTGLRGAADISRDGRVTLDEVYGWAWARTVESTFGSRGGVQRPSFKVDLSGQGQLVMSEPGTSSGWLELAVDQPGRWLVVSVESGTIVAELDKPKGPLRLALPAGRYRTRVTGDTGVLERTVQIPTTGGAVLRGDDLERASVVRVALKGESASVTFAAGGGVHSSLVNGVTLQPGIEVRASMTGVDFGPVNELVATFGLRDARSTGSGFRHSEFEVRIGVAHRFFVSRLSFSVGLELGVLTMLQNDLPTGTPRTSLGGTAQVVGEARLIIYRPLELYVAALGGGALVKKESGVTAVPRVAATAGLALSF